jgi:hypothetical protein
MRAWWLLDLFFHHGNSQPHQAFLILRAACACETFRMDFTDRRTQPIDLAQKQA